MLGSPAGAVIPDNTIIKISATLSRNMEVLSNSFVLLTQIYLKVILLWTYY